MPLDRILRYVFLAVLILWGAIATLQFFAAEIHEAVLLTDEGRAQVAGMCSRENWFCHGLFTIFASIGTTLTYASSLIGYVVMSVLALGAVLIRVYMRDNEWRVRFTLSPFIVLILFVLSMWGLLMSMGFSMSGGLPMNTVIEPTQATYPSVGVEGLKDLRDGFEVLQARGCLTNVGETVTGAGIYNYSFGCMQVGFFTRVLLQLLCLLFIVFNVLVLGRAVLHMLRLRQLTPLLEGVFSAGLGSGLFVALLWLIAVLGIFSTLTGWIVLIAIPLLLYKHSIHWLRTGWEERWTVDLEPWNVRVIIGWLLVSLLALNFLNVVRPFPIGWDDLGRYMNQPRLLVSYGHFIPTLATFSWEYITSMGFLLFGYNSVFGATLSMLINWSAGLLAVLSIYAFGRMYLGAGRGGLSALLYYILPMVGHFSFADMKVDNAIFAMGSLALLAAFLAVVPPKEDEEEGDDPSFEPVALSFIVLSGALASFGFSMKPTMIMVIMAIGALIVGVRLGWAGFLGVALLAWALFTKQDVFKTTDVFGRIFGDAEFLSRNTTVLLFAVIGLGFLAYAAWQKIPLLKKIGMQLALFGAAFVLFLLPWLVYNNIANHNWPPRMQLTAPNTIAPAFVVDDSDPPPFVETVRTLPPELQIDIKNPACVSTSKSEELDRYWGNYPGVQHYLTLPWRAIMNTDSRGYYVTLVPVLLLFPLLPFLPAFWTKRGRWIRWLMATTAFVLLQWVFFANGIVWYGVGMFLGLVLSVETLAALAPTRSTRWVMGVLIALSLLTAGGHRLWQFDIQRHVFEYPLGKVTAETMAERTIPHYNDIRDMILRRQEQFPEQPYTYRMGTFIPYFIPRNLEVLPLADHQLDFFNCLFQERDPVKTLARLKALGFNGMIFDTNTDTIETDQQGSLHKKVDAFAEFANTQGIGINVALYDTGAGISYILLQ